jgi:hypothetical protein
MPTGALQNLLTAGAGRIQIFLTIGLRDVVYLTFISRPVQNLHVSDHPASTQLCCAESII